MNTLTTFIIVLSVFGLYINLYGKTNLSDPELMDTSWLSKLQQMTGKEKREKPVTTDEVEKIMSELKLDPKILDKAKDVTPEEIENIINAAEHESALTEAPKEYNEIGEKNSEVQETQILNLGKNVKGGSSTRSYGWVRPSTVDKVDADGSMSKDYISYKNNFPYKTDELRMKPGDSKILESYANLTGKVFKQEAQIGTMILPDNTDAFDVKNTFTERATSIYKTRIGYENKILPDIRGVDSNLLKERDNLKLNSIDEMSTNIEIKTRPSLVGFKDKVDHMKTHEKLKPFNNLSTDIKNITRNYKLK